ncbi:basic membrane protein A [Entomoplasma freundtii]|uniref:Ribose/galactose ABC transporter substrate-binding protein n=1 Tax=Entomoplasma freundtii TaxID=74700 RepID=A0A2K8NS27_9MOLU|nr:BMP family ABC transporter substrate-binding protein [Entomoplasma freundtii]ATZ16640.1 ribose/galactose ABC transporter substrate-binding protein [Entomoplasma freundtii]TDY58193.1 basic membrane protein A [Entomoplasma freundtii]
MKKIILPLTGLTIALSAGSSVVSCIHAAYNPGLIGERIALITDAGRVTDKSFNQSMYEALNEYSNRKENPQEGGGFDFYNRGLSAKHNFVQPLKTDYADLVSAYKVAALKGTDMLILSGFQHANTVPVASQLVGPNKTVIFVDSDMNNQYNVINLVYNSQLAGFAAAYNTAVWATQKIVDGEGNWRYQGALHDPHKVSFGLFGGISSKAAVDNYLWGMMVAIQYFNENAKAHHNQYDNGQTPFVYFANLGKDGDVANIPNIEGSNSNYFSGSFEPGAATKAGIPSYLEENGADVIFPVAGPQTSDVLSGTKSYVIGVDSDQSVQYPSYAERFVTSATKNLKVSLWDAFDHSKGNRLNLDENGNLLPKPKFATDDSDGYWDGTIVTPKPAWSISIDQEAQIKNKVPPTAKFRESLVAWDKHIDKLKPLSDILVESYNKTGSKTTDYMNKELIVSVARALLAAAEPLPLTFPSDK